MNYFAYNKYWGETIVLFITNHLFLKKTWICFFKQWNIIASDMFLVELKCNSFVNLENTYD